jgi:hypothetical protein
VIIGDDMLQNVNMNANLRKKEEGDKPTGLLEKKWT